MTFRIAVVSILLSLLPISELRGAIPYALAAGSDVFSAYAVCVLANAVVGPLVYGFLFTLHRLLSLLAVYRSLFDRMVERARKRLRGKVERWGYLGLLLFVAVPLPVTGAYTGALGAWVLGMEPRKVFIAVAAGVAVAGLIVSVVASLGITALSIFIR